MEVLTTEERVKACETLATDLEAKGYSAKVWTSPARGVNQAGVGVEVRLGNDPDNVAASVTVGGKGFINFQKVSEALTTKQVNALGDAITYDSNYPVRPSQLTKVLAPEKMNGSTYRNPFLVRAGIITADGAGGAATKPHLRDADIPPPGDEDAPAPY
jgi:hypothetical protein